MRAIDAWHKLFSIRSNQLNTIGETDTELYQIIIRVADFIHCLIISEKFEDTSYIDSIESVFALYYTGLVISNYNRALNANKDLLLRKACELNNLYLNSNNVIVKDAVIEIVKAVKSVRSEFRGKSLLAVAVSILKRKSKKLINAIYRNIIAKTDIEKIINETDIVDYEMSEDGKIDLSEYGNLYFPFLWFAIRGYLFSRLFADNKWAQTHHESPEKVKKTRTKTTDRTEALLSKGVLLLDKTKTIDLKVRALSILSRLWVRCTLFGAVTTEYSDEMILALYKYYSYILSNAKSLGVFNTAIQDFKYIFQAIYRRLYDLSIDFGILFLESYLNSIVFNKIEININVITDNTKLNYTRFYCDCIGSIYNFPTDNVDDSKLWELYPTLARSKMFEYTLRCSSHARKIQLSQMLDSLKQKFDIESICKNIPDDSFLLDFYFVRKRYLTDKEGMAFYEDYSNLSKYDCNVVSVDSNGDISFGRQLVAIELNACIDIYLDKKVPREMPRFNPNADKYAVKNINIPLTFEEAEKRLKDFTDEILSAFDAEGRKRIIVSSESILNNISFASLPYKDGYVMDYFAVRNIANVYDLVNLRHRERINNSLVIYPNIPDLPDSEKEGDLVYASITQCDKRNTTQRDQEEYRLAGSNATKITVSQRIKNSKFDLLHITSHGKDQSGRLYIDLAGDCNNEANRIYEDELIELKSQATLAVLSLCWGGKMSEKVQDSLSGFIEALLQNGTNSVIAPLEKVNSRATLELFKIFYRKYFDETYSGKPIELVWKDTIKDFRNMKYIEVLTNAHGNQFDLEIDCNDPRHWMPWVIFSTE